MDKEIWKEIKDYEGLYQVSSFGKIKSLPRNTTIKKIRILKPSIDKDGYYRVPLSKNGIIKNYFVHRLVAEAFIPNPNNYPVINHKDENKQNNNSNNLEFCTIKYNTNYNGANIKRGLKQRKPIYQIKDGVIIKKWDSSTTASKELNINRGNIISCLNSKKKSAGGYQWERCYEI